MTFDARAATGAVRQSRRSTGQELCDVFWPGVRAGIGGRLSVTVNHGALSTINACASGRRPGSSSSVASADAVERHGAGVGLCATRVSLESPAPARRTLYKSRGACPASTHRSRQAPRRRENGNRRRRPAPACRNSSIRTFSSFSGHTWSVLIESNREREDAWLPFYHRARCGQ